MGLHMEYMKKKFPCILDWKGKVAASQLYWWSFWAAAPETNSLGCEDLWNLEAALHSSPDTEDEEWNSAFRILILLFNS